MTITTGSARRRRRLVRTPATPPEVAAFDPDRYTNAQLMAECARFGYLDGVVADVTYGPGKFWTQFRPDHLWCFDLDPKWGVEVVDCRQSPYPDNSFDTVVFDPPYKLNGTSTGKGPAASDEGYGVDGLYVTPEDRIELLLDGTQEALRLARRYALVKCADQISCGRYWPQTYLTWDRAAQVGATLVAQLYVVGRRAQPKNRPQRTVRNNISSLLVFRP